MLCFERILENQDCNDYTEMNYGTKTDVVICDDVGNEYYIPCVVGDCKAHTYPTGIVQTGMLLPNAKENLPEYNDGSMVEFCGTRDISGFDKYEIVNIIVYENN